MCSFDVGDAKTAKFPPRPLYALCYARPSSSLPYWLEALSASTYYRIIIFTRLAILYNELGSGEELLAAMHGAFVDFVYVVSCGQGGNKAWQTVPTSLSFMKIEFSPSARLFGTGTRAGTKFVLSTKLLTKRGCAHRPALKRAASECIPLINIHMYVYALWEFRCTRKKQYQ